MSGRGTAAGRPLRVLFLCTGNACRSQIAEGWLRRLGGADYLAGSAGIEAHGLDQRAVAVMREAGVDISEQRSKVLEPEWLQATGLLVTVCGHADEHCPVAPASCAREHWPFEDPARASGSSEEVLAEFRRVRDEIRARVERFVGRR